MTKDELKAEVCRVIEANSKEIYEIGDTIWKNPESGFKEFKTAALAVKKFQELGLPYRDKIGITGARADFDTKKEGPVLAILGEMDSLILPTHPEADPETGAVHACGHHASIAGMFGAAIGLVKSGAAGYLAGKIAFITVPAEEGIEISYRQQLMKEGKINNISGKSELIFDGAFDDVNLSYMLHTTNGYFHCGDHNGILAKFVTFKGKSCHAASPQKGINALDAATLAQNALGLLRQKWASDPTFRLHGIISNGGSAVNIIPDTAVLEYFIRSSSIENMQKINDEFDRAMQGCADVFGAAVNIKTFCPAHPLRENKDIIQVYRENAQKISGCNVPVEPKFAYSSTDMGDVGAIVPVVHAYARGAAGTEHGIDFHIADKELAYIENAKIIACMAIDLMYGNAEKAREIAAQREGLISVFEYKKLMKKLTRLDD